MFYHNLLFTMAGCAWCIVMMFFMRRDYEKKLSDMRNKFDRDIDEFDREVAELFSYFSQKMNEFIGDEEVGHPVGEAKRTSLSNSIRFDVMQRDDFACQLCGKTREDGVKLEVDHKVPVSKGGSDRMENLWTLCNICNSGKSNKLLGQWVKLYRCVNVSSGYYSRKYCKE